MLPLLQAGPRRASRNAYRLGQILDALHQRHDTKRIVHGCSTVDQTGHRFTARTFLEDRARHQCRIDHETFARRTGDERLK